MIIYKYRVEVEEMDEAHISELFLHIKPVQILMALRLKGENSYASTLAKIADCTYSHTVKILEAFKAAGLVTFNKKGRVKYVELTKLGEEFAKDFESLTKKFDKVAVKK